MGRMLPIAVAVVLWGHQAVHAQEKVDLTGVWIMDVGRSSSAASVVAEPVRAPVRLNITQSPTTLTIVRERPDRAPETIGYAIVQAAPPAVTPPQPPGVSAASVEPQMPSGSRRESARAEWAGAHVILTTVWVVNGKPVSTHERLALGAGGRELTVETVLQVHHGYEILESEKQKKDPARDVYLKGE